MRYLIKTHLCGQVERIENASLGISFYFVFFKIKTGTFESVLLRLGFTLSTNPGGTLRLFFFSLKLPLPGLKLSLPHPN